MTSQRTPTVRFAEDQQQQHRQEPQTSRSLPTHSGPITRPAFNALQERIKILERDLEAQNQQVVKYYQIAQNYHQTSRQWEKKYVDLVNRTHSNNSQSRAPGSSGSGSVSGANRNSGATTCSSLSIISSPFDLSPPAVDYDLIIHQWTHIRRLIQNFITQYFTCPSTSTARSATNHPRTLPRTTVVATELKYLTRHPAHYLASPALRPFLLQSFLTSKLFTPRYQYAWAGQHARAFRTLARSLQPMAELHDVQRRAREGILDVERMRSFMRWRAWTAGRVADVLHAEAGLSQGQASSPVENNSSVAGSVSGSTRDNSETVSVDKIFHSVTNVLKPFTAINGVEKTQEFKQDLQHIIQQSIDFGLLRYRSIAFINIEEGCMLDPLGVERPYGFAPRPDYDESPVEFSSIESHYKVELTVTPILYALGSNMGQGYTVKNVLSKGVVICEETRQEFENYIASCLTTADQLGIA